MREFQIIEDKWDRLPPALQYWILIKVIIMTTPKHVVAGVAGIALITVDTFAPGGILLAAMDLAYIIWAAWFLVIKTTF
jgi:hypothetical protein